MTGRAVRSAGATALDRLVGIPVERLIAGSRFALAVGALAAIYFDPLQPSRGDVGYLLLLSYVLFAAVSLIAAARGFHKWPLLSHLVDICLITGVMYYTEGPTSPYFVLFSFLLFSGTLQWEWFGAIATGALLVLLIVALSQFGLVDPFEIGETDRLIMRATYLLVASALFAYVGAYLARARRRLVQLAVWPAPAPQRGTQPALQAQLAHAAKVVGAGRALVAWEHREEPFRFLALATVDGISEHRTEKPDRYGTMVAAEYQMTTFAFDRCNGGVLDKRGRHSRNDAIDPELMRQYGIRSAVSAPFSGLRCHGRLFLLDLPDIDADDLALCDIAAHRIQEELDRHALEQEAEQVIQAGERTRVARDLHDGTLQTLTAARLQIANLDHAEDAEGRLQTIGDLLQREQQRIREFVEAADQERASGTRGDSSAPLNGLAQDLALQWDCDVSLRTDPAELHLPDAVGDGLRMMIREAVANAARHGAAGRVDILIAKRNGSVELTVRDNGCGFHETKAGEKRSRDRAPSPASLGARVKELGGSISLTSDSSGASVYIRLPVP